MKVSYINSEIHGDFARVTFVGHDTKGRRRPVIDLCASDLGALVGIARSFRSHQRWLARRANGRADAITQSGVTE